NRKTLAAMSLVFATTVEGALKQESVAYSDHGTALEGYVVYDESNKKPEPGILIVHDWLGLGPFAKEKAEKLAKQGYVVFAVDIYGKGVRPKDDKEAALLAKKYGDDRELFRSRMRAAYGTLTAMKQVNPHKIVVMGYCFGGTGALELARSG